MQTESIIEEIGLHQKKKKIQIKEVFKSYMLTFFLII